LAAEARQLTKVRKAVEARRKTKEARRETEEARKAAEAGKEKLVRACDLRTASHTL